MPPAVTLKDVLAAVERLGRQSDARWEANVAQMATLGAGQQNLDRRMTSLEAEMKSVAACVNINTGRISVLESQSNDYDTSIQQLEDREREGAIKQGGLAVALSTVVSVVMAWLYDRMRV